MATMTAQAFNRDVSAAKRLAEEDGPLFITHRGQTRFVLLTIEDYERMRGRGNSLIERLSMDDDLDVELPRMTLDDLKIPDFDS